MEQVAITQLGIIVLGSQKTIVCYRIVSVKECLTYQIYDAERLHSDFVTSSLRNDSDLAHCSKCVCRRAWTTVVAFIDCGIRPRAERANPIRWPVNEVPWNESSVDQLDFFLFDNPNDQGIAALCGRAVRAFGQDSNDIRPRLFEDMLR